MLDENELNTFSSLISGNETIAGSGSALVSVIRRSINNKYLDDHTNIITNENTNWDLTQDSHSNARDIQLEYRSRSKCNLKEKSIQLIKNKENNTQCNYKSSPLSLERTETDELNLIDALPFEDLYSNSFIDQDEVLNLP